MDIVTGSIGGEIHLFRRQADGAYTAGVTLRRPFRRSLEVGSGSAVALADWDGDGDLDLLVGSSAGEVFLSVNEGTGQKPRWGKPQPLAAGGRPIQAAGGSAGPCVADWDGDGLPDLLLGDGSGAVSWHRNEGTRAQPKLAAAQVLVKRVERSAADTAKAETPARSQLYAKVCVVDWNADKLPDLIVGDYYYDSRAKTDRSHGWVWVYLRRPVPSSATSKP